MKAISDSLRVIAPTYSGAGIAAPAGSNRMHRIFQKLPGGTSMQKNPAVSG